MINFKSLCENCKHDWLRHGTGKATEGGKCNQCEMRCEKYVFPENVKKKDK